jgi:hypothetical protein
MDQNDIKNFKKLTPIFSKNRSGIITLDDNKLHDELKCDQSNDLTKDEKLKEQKLNNNSIVKINKKIKKNKLRDSGEKMITSLSDINNASILTTKKSKKKEILVTQTTGNTNVKEMPLNPFDFIWDTNSLMPKIEENMECITNNEVLANLKLNRNKTSIFGAKLAKLNENEKTLTELNMNELIIPTLTSTIASFANNNVSSENTMITNTTIAAATPTTINISNNNSSNSSNNNTIERKKLTKKKKEKANLNIESFENNNDQTVTNSIIKTKKSKRNKNNDIIFDDKNKNIEVNRDNCEKLEENLVLIDQFSRKNKTRSGSSDNGDSIKMSTKKAKQHNILTEVDVGNMNISLI